MTKCYLVDTCGDWSDIREYSSMEDAKAPLYAAWQDDSENGWTVEEIDCMNKSLVEDALEGIGFLVAGSYEEAIELLEEGM